MPSRAQHSGAISCCRGELCASMGRHRRLPRVWRQRWSPRSCFATAWGAGFGAFGSSHLLYCHRLGGRLRVRRLLTDLGNALRHVGLQVRRPRTHPLDDVRQRALEKCVRECLALARRQAARARYAAAQRAAARESLHDCPRGALRGTHKAARTAHCCPARECCQQGSTFRGHLQACAFEGGWDGSCRAATVLL